MKRASSGELKMSGKEFDRIMSQVLSTKPKDGKKSKRTQKGAARRKRKTARK